MPAEIIYDVYKDGKYIGDYTSKELQEKLNMHKTSVSASAKEGRLVRRHYRILEVDRKINKGNHLLIDFDLTTRAILRRAGRT